MCMHKRYGLSHVRNSQDMLYVCVYYVNYVSSTKVEYQELRQTPYSSHLLQISKDSKPQTAGTCRIAYVPEQPPAIFPP